MVSGAIFECTWWSGSTWIYLLETFKYVLSNGEGKHWEETGISIEPKKFKYTNGASMRFTIIFSLSPMKLQGDFSC